VVPCGRVFRPEFERHTGAKTFRGVAVGPECHQLVVGAPHLPAGTDRRFVARHVEELEELDFPPLLLEEDDEDEDEELELLDDELDFPPLLEDELELLDELDELEELELLLELELELELLDELELLAPPPPPCSPESSPPATHSPRYPAPVPSRCNSSTGAARSRCSSSWCW
jgi:hypothetical protein